MAAMTQYYEHVSDPTVILIIREKIFSVILLTCFVLLAPQMSLTCEALSELLFRRRTVDSRLGVPLGLSSSSSDSDPSSSATAIGTALSG